MWPAMPQAMRMPLFGKQGGGILSSLFSKIGRQGTEEEGDMGEWGVGGVGGGIFKTIREAEAKFLRLFELHLSRCRSNVKVKLGPA